MCSLSTGLPAPVNVQRCQVVWFAACRRSASWLTTLRRTSPRAAPTSCAGCMSARSAASAPLRLISARLSGEYQAECGVQYRLGTSASGP